MNNYRLSVIALIFLIVIINIPPVKFLFGSDDCKYSNDDGSFTFEEINFNERNYEMSEYKFEEFKKIPSKDTILYRLCPINIFYVWKYGDYLFNKKYRLPYKPWQEIEAHRKPVINKSGFQDF